MNDILFAFEFFYFFLFVVMFSTCFVIM